MNRRRNHRVPGMVSLLFAFFLVWTSAAQAAPPSVSAAPTAAGGGPTTTTVPASQLRTARPSHSSAKSTGKQPKLDSSVAEVSQAAKASKAKAVDVAKSNKMATSADLVQVYVTARSGQAAKASAAIKAAGGKVTKTDGKSTLLQAWIPVDQIDQVAASADVAKVSSPDLGVPDTGTITSEGIAVSGADAWQAAGYRGAGAKIAVVDAGFQGYTSLKGTDIPNSVIVKNFVDGQTDVQVDETDVHGTACAEIVYDMAPDAQLYLVKVATSLDLQEAVAWLGTQGVDVISMSLSWLNEGPGDGTGLVSDLVSQARDSGIVWFTSAGNYRQRHWGGPFVDSNGDGDLNFSSTVNEDFLAPGDHIHYYVFPSGANISVFLRWSDWADHNQDYDLYLWSYNPSTQQWSANPVAWSEDYQTGQSGQTPTEQIFYTTTAPGLMYAVEVYAARVDSGRSVNMELITPSAELDYQVAARSVSSPSDSRYAVSVGAVDVVSPYSQEVYSSEGPTNGPGGTATGGIVKPDIAAYANVSTVTYGTTNKFNGTSAATPHVAGAAALVAGAVPSYSPDQIASFLTGRAIHLGTAGQNNQYGNGRLSLAALPTQVCGDISSDTTWTTGNVYVATCTVVVKPGVTLTVQPGVTVGFGDHTGLDVQGTLTAVGTVDHHVSFTSSSASPSAGIWNGIRFASTSTGSHLSFAEVRFGGYAWSGPAYQGGVVVDGASPTIDNTTFASSSANHVFVTGSGNPVVSSRNSFLCDSTNYNSLFGVSNASTGTPPTIDATGDFWGDPTGPYNASSNPSGKGCQVSANVAYDNWIGGTPQVTFLPQPVRVVDTRKGSGYQGAGSSLNGYAASRRYNLAGQGGVPTNATAVLVNLTAVGYTANGWLAAWPACATRPTTSNVNFDTRENAIANFAIVKLGTGSGCQGAIDVTGAFGTNVIVDVVGYLQTTADDQINFLDTPQRVVDTRANSGFQGAGQALNGYGGSRRFTLAGQKGIPANATAVLVNLTAVGYPANGWLAAWPACATVPATSNVNFDTKENAIANFAIVKLGTGTGCQGMIDVRGASGTNVIVDVAGYLVSTPYDQIVLLSSPQRIVDTRSGSGYQGAGVKLTDTANPKSYQLGGQGEVPADAKGVITNLTTVGYTSNGWVAAYPTGGSVPATSSVNFDTDENAIANTAIVRLGTGGTNVGKVNLVACAPTNAIVDVSGYLR